MSCASCRYFDSCSAPICPEDPSSLVNCAWFPDEESCHRGDLKGAPWLVRQRKIARTTGKDPSVGCFTQAMLAHRCKIGKGIKGLDPEDGPITPERSRRWIAGRAVASGKAPSGRRFSAKTGAGTPSPGTPGAETLSKAVPGPGGAA